MYPACLIALINAFLVGHGGMVGIAALTPPYGCFGWCFSYGEGRGFPMAADGGGRQACGMSDYRRLWVPGGTYFFTVNLADRSRRLLMENIDALRMGVAAVRVAHPFETVAWCVLPDHLHVVWTLPPGDDDFATRWMLIKAQFSRRIENSERLSASRRKHHERCIWQRRYWEHLIRDERDLRNHIDYIHSNPVKHGWAQRPGEWRYSSFHRFVREGVLPADWVSSPGPPR